MNRAALIRSAFSSAPPLRSCQNNSGSTVPNEKTKEGESWNNVELLDRPCQMVDSGNVLTPEGTERDVSS